MRKSFFYLQTSGYFAFFIKDYYITPDQHRIIQTLAFTNTMPILWSNTQKQNKTSMLPFHISKRFRLPLPLLFRSLSNR